MSAIIGSFDDLSHISAGVLNFKQYNPIGNKLLWLSWAILGYFNTHTNTLSLVTLFHVTSASHTLGPPSALGTGVPREMGVVRGAAHVMPHNAHHPVYNSISAENNELFTAHKP